MARRVILIDSLTQPERRRVEALKCAIEIARVSNPGGYAELEAYLNDAEAIENWFAKASDGREDDLPERRGE